MYMLKTESWYVERALFLVAGIFIMGSVVLSLLQSPYWLILTGLVGLNLFVLSLTGFCLMGIILNKLGLKPRLGKAGCCSVEAKSE